MNQSIGIGGIKSKEILIRGELYDLLYGGCFNRGQRSRIEGPVTQVSADSNPTKVSFLLLTVSFVAKSVCYSSRRKIGFLEHLLIFVCKVYRNL